MKQKILQILLSAIFLCQLCACGDGRPVPQTAEAASETVSIASALMSDMAREAAENALAAYENLVIEQTNYYTWDESGRVLMEYQYTSDNGSGFYCVVVYRDGEDNVSILCEGFDVTIENKMNGRIEVPAAE